MVDGLQIKKPLVVVDLDGTLISGNSLHEYIKLGMKKLLDARSYAKAAALLGIVGLRKLHLVTHTAMKWRAKGIIGFDKQLRKDLSAKLSELLRPAVAALINEYREKGCTVIIATASFDFIANALAEFDGHHCLSTMSEGNPHHIECRGTLKAAAVKKYLERQNAYLAAVITDHYDDLPLLMLDAEQRYLVNPSARTSAIIAASDIDKIKVI